MKSFNQVYHISQLVYKLTYYDGGQSILEYSGWECDLEALIFILHLSSKIIMISNKSKNLIRNYSYSLLLILVSVTFISLMTNLLMTDSISINSYYSVNILYFLIMIIILRKKNAFL